jgi:chromosome segregation ATPase
MNRSILIVICDFLLISLLAFSTVDINKVGEEGTQRTVQVESATNRVEASGKDLAAVMQLALDEERKSRDQLLGELSRARTAMTEGERQAQSLQEQLQNREQQAQQLQQQRFQLEQQFTAAQTNILQLNRQLQSTAGEASLSKERLSQTEAEARRQAEEAAALQQRLAQLARSNQIVLSEKQQLASRLQVAEVERRHANEQAAAMQEQVKIEREEKAKLAEGVKVLATQSGQLAEEIRENRPLAPNTIFNDFASNRVEARINAYRTGFFGNETGRDARHGLGAIDRSAGS